MLVDLNLNCTDQKCKENFHWGSPTLFQTEISVLENPDFENLARVTINMLDLYN